MSETKVTAWEDYHRGHALLNFKHSKCPLCHPQPQSSVPAPAGATQNAYEQHGHLPECIYWQNDEECNCDWKGWPKLAGSLAERPVTPRPEPGATTQASAGLSDEEIAGGNQEVFKSPQPEWPREISLSMSPFMYTCTARQTENTDICIAYQCEGDRHTGCGFKASFDPRDMQPDAAKQLFHWHFNQSH